MAVSRSGRYILLVLVTLAAIMCAGTASAQTDQRDPRANAAAIKAEAATADLQARQLRVLVGRSCATHQNQRCRVYRERLARAKARAARLHKILTRSSGHRIGASSLPGFTGSGTSTGSSSPTGHGSSPASPSPAPSPVSPILYPVSPTPNPATTPPIFPAPTPTSKIIGTNDGAGWGPSPAKTILAGHITWNRVEIGSEDNTLAESLNDGFHVLAIVGNVQDNTPLSQVDPDSWAATVVSQFQANPGIAIAEAGNEMFLKGDAANPIQYGRMYLAAVDAMKAAGIHTPLLFNMFGDYPVGSLSSSTWSRDSGGGGWLHDAVAAVPGLATAILVNGLSTHPYGALGENSTDSWGVNAVAAQESAARTVLGAVPPFYITEFGYDLGSCGETDGACSQQEQASKMRSAYAAFLSDPHVAGIWSYQSHNDSTGQWGYMNNDNTTRPTFAVISSIATEEGQ
jgi:hypothetical protein